MAKPPNSNEIQDFFTPQTVRDALHVARQGQEDDAPELQDRFVAIALRARRIISE